MKTILITGSLGFIGSHLLELFLKKNFYVIGIDNLSNNYSMKIYMNNLNILKSYKNFIFYKENILNRKKISYIVKKHKPGYVINCAAKVGVRNSIKNPYLYNKVNVLGSQNLLDCIRLYRLKTKTVLISSSSVYGDQKKLPFSEKMPSNPLSPYALSKNLMEAMAKQYAYLFQMPIVIIRAFSVYGPRGRCDMLPFMIFHNYIKNKPIIIYGSNKNNQRDWTYIDDFKEALFEIIKNDNFNFKIYNIGSGKSVGIDDFVKYFILRLNKYYGYKKIKIKRLKRNKIETSITQADISEARKDLNYKPKVSYKIGINNTVKFLIQNQSIYLS